MSDWLSPNPPDIANPLCRIKKTRMKEKYIIFLLLILGTYLNAQNSATKKIDSNPIQQEITQKVHKAEPESDKSIDAKSRQEIRETLEAKEKSDNTTSENQESIWKESETYKDILIVLSPFLVLLWTTFKENKFNKDKHKRDVEIANLTNTHQIAVKAKENIQSKEISELKHKFELDKKEFDQKISLTDKSIDTQKECSKNIHSTLTRMLFKVQNLYMKLSTSCADKECLVDEITKFEKGFSECSENISDHMVFVSPKITNNVYSFFQFLGLLINELKSIKDGGDAEFEKAHSAVYLYSSRLATYLVEIQKYIVELDPNCEFEVDEEKLEEMIYCCGTEPTDEKLIEYCKVYPEPTGLKEKILDDKKESA